MTKLNLFKNSRFLLLLFIILVSYSSNAQQISNQIPFVGAEVFIEPGQTPEEIDSWFKVMKEQRFSVCRIRMFEAYMRKADGSWDFKLFDNAFISAEKYGIKIYANPFALTDKTDIGGFKFPRDSAHLESIAQFIKAMTIHFSQFPSLIGYVLINEPGLSGEFPKTDFSRIKYNEWKSTHAQEEFTKQGFPVLVDLQKEAFVVDYNTWFLKWIATEIMKYDKKHEIHVNNHNMFVNCAEYNFPAWREFLTSFGGSAHASWHFSYFSRSQYALAMSANCEIIKSGAGEIPWFMTELQGGNNTYSGLNPMCPTKEEIAQWLWLVTATNGKGSIFWCLNPRSSGIEAGEWALLDFQNKPSDRMLAASDINEVITKNAALFSNAKEIESGINILYIRQSMWAETKMATSGAVARSQGAVIKSALAYFSTLSEMGVNANVKAFEEFDFSKPDYTGKTIILSHQISVPDKYSTLLESFVSKGGKLIVDGLTAFFDENLVCTMKTGFAFEKLFGGKISEFKLLNDNFKTPFQGIMLPTHFWRGYIVPTSGKSIEIVDNKTIAIRNKIGNGETLWIPSMIGLGSWIVKDNSALAKLIGYELSKNLSTVPVRFKYITSNLIMKTMQYNGIIVTVIINNSESTKTTELSFLKTGLKPTVLYSNMSGSIEKSNKIIINSGETIVIKWEENNKTNS